MPELPRVEPYVLEVVVNEDGCVLLPSLPFAPGTKLLVTVEEAEPMDAEAFEAALREHYSPSRHLDGNL